jgi:hypothetical protein
VHLHYHYDDYKRSESYSKVENIFVKEEDAYEYCIKKLYEYLKSNNYLLNNVEIEMGIEKNNESYESDEENDTKLYKIFLDKDKTFKERYNIIKDNFEYFFGEPEFTLQPTHEMYYVTVCHFG